MMPSPKYQILLMLSSACNAFLSSTNADGIGTLLWGLAAVMWVAINIVRMRATA